MESVLNDSQIDRFMREILLMGRSMGLAVGSTQKAKFIEENSKMGRQMVKELLSSLMDLIIQVIG